MSVRGSMRGYVFDVFESPVTGERPVPVARDPLSDVSLMVTEPATTTF